MTNVQRLKQLATIGWLPESDPKSGDHLQHKISGERCWWISGLIDRIEWHAWLSDSSGMVYLQTSPGIDKPFDEFCELVKNGWPKRKVAPAARSLFGDDSD